ncbi:MAG: ribose 5-phosphate isomerase B [Deltaproteobacteria bacterium]|nr:ribose 5-phosphate isomerase B [Deltaproteobacteria bacterium]
MNQNLPPIIIGCDHAAFNLKKTLINYLTKNQIVIKDVGTFNTDSIDYPDIAAKVASGVSAKKYQKGILMCGTGIGMSIAANRFPGVMAALCNDLFSAEMSRRHNDSNILVIGGRVVGDILAIAILNKWLTTPFEGGRHKKRIEMFDAIT